MTLQAEAARDCLTAAPARTDALLAELIGQFAGRHCRDPPPDLRAPPAGARRPRPGGGGAHAGGPLGAHPGADRRRQCRFRDGLRALLSSAPGFEVAGEVGTGEEAIARARAIQPDVVLMDLRMPGLDGIEATRRISRDSPHVAVLALTMLADDDSVFAAMRAGARGYLLKGALKAEILRTIQGGGQRRCDLRTRHRAAPDAVFCHGAAARAGPDVPGADRARGRDPDPDRPGSHQRGDR